MVDFPNTELILSRELVGLDSETTGLRFWLDRAFGISLAWRDDQGNLDSFYLDIRNPNEMRWARDHIPRLQATVGHHLKFDAHMLREQGIKLRRDQLICTMVTEAILEESRYDYSLDFTANKYLGRGKVDPWVELAQMFGGKADKDTQIVNLHRAPRELVAKYATVDAELPLEIFEFQWPLIQEQELEQIYELERNLLWVVVDLEYRGVPVDLNRAEQAVGYFDKQIVTDQKQLNTMAGGPVNVNSGPQTKKLMQVHKDDQGLWRTGDGLVLDPTESGNSGSLSTSKLYNSTMPEAKLIADIRGMVKARDVFLKTYILGMNHNGIIHANFNQTRSEEGDGTYTGRFSITEPALQQIHKRQKKMAAIVRACFVPDPDTEWGCWDYSQIDFRCMASYANDPAIIEAYRLDPYTDYHKIAAAITGLPRDRDEKTGGANAKQVNLGLSFNMGEGKLAAEMGLPYQKRKTCFGCNCKSITLENAHCPQCGGSLRDTYVAGDEAKAIFENYHTHIPGPGKLKKTVSGVAKARGYIMTQLKRRIRFPNKSQVYKASGILYQASAAEILKVKMVQLFDLFESCNHDSRLMLCVHDEMDCSLDPGRSAGSDAEVTALLERFEGDPLRFRVPMRTSFGKGSDWWVASK